MRSRWAHWRPGILWTTLAAVTLIACCCKERQIQKAPPASQSWEATRSALQGRDHFALKGRVAVAAGKDGFSASLRWTQAGSRAQGSVEGALGAGGGARSSSGA